MQDPGSSLKNVECVYRALNSAQAEEEGADRRRGSQVVQGPPSPKEAFQSIEILIVPHLIKGTFACLYWLTGQGKGDGESWSDCPFQKESFGVSDCVREE